MTRHVLLAIVRSFAFAFMAGTLVSGGDFAAAFVLAAFVTAINSVFLTIWGLLFSSDRFQPYRHVALVMNAAMAIIWLAAASLSDDLSGFPLDLIAIWAASIVGAYALTPHAQ